MFCCAAPPGCCMQWISTCNLLLSEQKRQPSCTKWAWSLNRVVIPIICRCWGVFGIWKVAPMMSLWFTSLKVKGTCFWSLAKTAKKKGQIYQVSWMFYIDSSPRLISGDSDQTVLFSPESTNTKNRGILPHSCSVDLFGFCQCDMWCSVWFNHTTGNKRHHSYTLFVSGPLQVHLTFDPSDCQRVLTP